MTRRRLSLGLVVLLLLGSVLLVAPRTAAADDATDELAARMLGTAELRMQAKIEEARILAAAGRTAEALKALEEVPRIHERAMADVAALRAQAPSAEPEPGRWTAPPPSRPRAEPRPRIRIGPRATPREPIVERLVPARDPAPGAVRYLLGSQRKDGHFGSLGGAPEPETTAFAVAALLDAAKGEDPEVRTAVRRGATALAGYADDDLPEGMDAAVLAWALAGAYARIGEPAWREPLRRLVAKSSFLLVEDRAARAEGRPSLRPYASRYPVEGAFRALWILAMLVEIEPLDETVPDDPHIASLREEVDEVAATLDLTADPAAGFARDLLRQAARLPEDASGVAGPAGIGRRAPLGSRDVEPQAPSPLALLLGTVFVRSEYGTEDVVEGTQWWNRALVPVANLQVADGPEAGSWTPRDERSQERGRVWTTAVTLLAWTAWYAPWQAPVAR